MIIEIMGGRGVGKSTIIKNIKKYYPDCIIREGFRKIDNHLDLNIREFFIQNERQYLQREINELIQFEKSKKLVLITRGPQELKMYMDFYLQKYHNDWNIQEQLKQELVLLEKHYPLNTIFLDMSEEKLRYYIENDKEKQRYDVDFWLEFNTYEKKYLANNSNIYFLNVENMDLAQKTEAVLKFIKKKDRSNINV